jgi:hypothetical protein
MEDAMSFVYREVDNLVGKKVVGNGQCVELVKKYADVGTTVGWPRSSFARASMEFTSLTSGAVKTKWRLANASSSQRGRVKMAILKTQAIMLTRFRSLKGEALCGSWR